MAPFSTVINRGEALSLFQKRGQDKLDSDLRSNTIQYRDGRKSEIVGGLAKGSTTGIREGEELPHNGWHHRHVSSSKAPKQQHPLSDTLQFRHFSPLKMSEKITMADIPSDERTPLIQVVQIRPYRARYPHHNLRRSCTLLLTAIPAFVAAIVITILIYPDILGFGSRDPRRSVRLPNNAWPKSEGLNYKELQDILKETPKAEKAREWSKYYTSGPHLAGKNLSQALWTKDRWEEFGVKSSIVTYDIYVNYPINHRLALLEKEGSSKTKPESGADGESEADWKVKFEATLEEDVLEEDGTSGLEDRIPTFHGYSANGNVTAPYVFVNYGTYQDFEDLLAANISLAGKIALIKYSHIFRGLKVKRAQELGMIGAVIYSDPGDDGEIRKVNGYETYPDGPARNPSSVQRGSTQFLSIAPGDPTTPGYPSLPGAPRQPVDNAIPSIPSLPLSYAEAIPLLKALNGHGPNASSFNKYWHTGGLGHKGVHYNIGPSPDDLVLNLYNAQEYVITPMWNVIGVINGTIPDEAIVLGNHRDAWIAGGAGDPNSGSAALNEVIRSFGVALEAGWKPMRTIVFASWDGEEYGLLGSTEWVEEYIPWLTATNIAYLNVDIGAVGSYFKAAGAPLLNKALMEATQLVLSPNQTVENQTVYDTWDKHISTMGSGSDFTAFQDFAGIPCVDIGFNTGPDSPVYHYHSNYDSFDWMDKFGDPGFHYHEAISKVWALLAANLAETPVIQLNATDYATALKAYLLKLEDKAANSPIFSQESTLFTSIEKALDRLHNSSVTFDAHAADLLNEVRHADIPWWKWWKKVKLYYAVRQVNNAYKELERQFLYAPGLDSRPWFKHVVFAPGLWTGYAGATYPGLVEAIDDGDKGGAYRWAGIIAGLVNKAAGTLE
ncbi:N-acetylated-alpha-linked acidic dipeptidase-like protein [Patellaria atrata CBS 101060]|uniref:N-acetylated-alpha-linked acidic dipeptidase-like protein n=1 Tax=Patellaria atrata CBS 101060 TaxID=1346257 RepID=A0A9P4SEK1_9PEZI|nr:N-acetylated-alpha-linked acidic dipeptidase-like protein [Patellaria atrata CBS 101060]